MDWVLGIALTVMFLAVVYIAFEVHQNARAIPTRASIARQIKEVRALVALALVEQKSPFERARLQGVHEHLVALSDLSDQSDHLFHIQGRLRAFVHFVHLEAEPHGELAERALDWLVARENGGDS